MSKESILTITASDCDWKYTKGSGAGGQKKNKTSSAVHCFHRESGAHGYSEDTRSQHDNKRIAFKRMADTKEFRQWHKLETMKRMGQLAVIEDEVNRQMRQIKIEGVVDGKWEELKPL